jgi:hypothetical protein
LQRSHLTRHLHSLQYSGVFSSWLGISYSTSYPVGDFKDYNSKPSFSGFSIEYKTNVHENIAVGINMGFNFFNEYVDKSSYTYETITATGKQRRHSSTIPMMATIAYTGALGEKAHWFAGLGVGTTYIYRYTNFASFTFSRETWQFLLAPEVGVWYPLVEDNILYLTGRYHGNFKNDEMAAQTYFSLNLGWAAAW